jgi:1-acyl-sn-glycerol-3-phosphate acyltransferase
MRAIARFIRVCAITSAFFFFWTLGVLIAWTVFPALRLIHRDRQAHRRACQRIQKQAFRVFHGYMHLLALLKVSVAERPTSRPGGAFVMVANHPTLVDVTALLATHDDVCCVVKTSLTRNPFIGPWLRHCGHIDGGDGEGMSGAAAMQEALDRLAEGSVVLIFPEGTRSPLGGMHPFRRGAFEIAGRAGVPVVPMFLTCEPPALMKGLPFWAQPDSTADLRIEELPAISSAQPEGGSRALCRRVEADLRFRLDTRRAPAKDAPVAAEIGLSEA